MNFFVPYKVRKGYFMMKIKMKNIIAFSMVFLIIFSISIQHNVNNYIEPHQENFERRTPYLKLAGFWNNFTFIHITGSNWTIANQTEWCTGSGTWANPYLIENMIINASTSPVGSGILIENSGSAFFALRNVTIFEGTNGIRLENTNNGAVINSNLSNNVDSGLSLVNCENNTISSNKLINNGMQGIYLFSYCLNNKILGNTIKNDGTEFQNTGIYLEDFCDNNEILGNFIFDNNDNGIVFYDDCKNNLVYNNTIRNTITTLQDWGIRIQNGCDQNNISLNLIEDINIYGIYIVTSDGNSISNNQIIEVSTGMYMLIDQQSDIINNTISGGSSGIIMSACNWGEIIGNFINDTTTYGIRMYTNCDNNDFHDNFIKDNSGIGIQLYEPLNDNNLFYRNSFISNGIHVFDNGTSNFWNNSVIGNYWDNYSGVDLDNDHVGDTPLSIPGGATSNDTLPIFDPNPPIITINTPTSKGYGIIAPGFNIFVNETYLYSMWYTINNGGKKYYFTENGTIDQDVWDTLDEDNLILTFYARDIAWRLDSDFVTLHKDTIIPSIEIISPLNGQIFNNTAPNFTVAISDDNLDKMWYTLSGNLTKNIFLINGTIRGWFGLSDGEFTITFFANDTAGNTGSAFLILNKSTSQIPGNGLPPFDIIPIVIILIVISVIIIAGVILRKPIMKTLKKSRKLSEEQITEAQYFSDITSILTILAIHNDSGLCLSKLALHGGIGLDENLFTGFISAMGSFKNELAQQMGLPVKGGGGGNVIEYNEFTITLMDGEYLRLGLVSHSSLGDLIKERCGRVLMEYELKHVNELKIFDGEIQGFSDFENTIETGLDINLNKKSTVNIKQLNKYDASEQFKTILNDFNSRSEGFYPAEIAVTLVKAMNISKQEASLMVYEAYKDQLFLPIN
jgi:parallel beta-helix repeat protein